MFVVVVVVIVVFVFVVVVVVVVVRRVMNVISINLWDNIFVFSFLDSSINNKEILISDSYYNLFSPAPVTFS